MNAAARSLLFVPGSRPDRFAKALASGADLVIIDLEDAVPPDQKDAARTWVAQFLSRSPQTRVLVRINALTSVHAQADLALCAAHAGVGGVMVPKADTCAVLLQAQSAGKPVWPIVESAQAVVNLGELARAPGVARLVLGNLDLALDLGMNADSEAAMSLLDQTRYAMLLHSRLAGLPAPIDGVFAQTTDPEGLQRMARRACDMGFGGALCIHPSQVPVLNAQYAPSPAQLDQARRIVAAANRQPGAFLLDGRMVDAPVIERARRVLVRAAETPV